MMENVEARFADRLLHHQCRRLSTWSWDRLPEAAQSDSRSLRTTRRKDILLVDRHADSRHMYTEFFGYYGFWATPVSTAGDALAIAPWVDVIVTEILLSGEVDGLRLITRLKNDHRTSGIPLVVVTSCARATDRERAQLAGCDVFLSKPCLPHDLMRAVCELLTRSAFAEAPDRPFGPSAGPDGRSTIAAVALAD